MLRGKTLSLDGDTASETFVASLKAVASLPRWRILEYLGYERRSVHEIAQALDMPPATAAAHIKILEESGFVHTELQAASRGLQKIVSRGYDNVIVELPGSQPRPDNAVEVSMPVGAYTGFDVTPTCGLASETALIGHLDDPLSFYEPDRMKASLVWFRSGYLEYSFPNRMPAGAEVVALELSMEIGSEAPLHNNNWPSDITLWINGHELGSWMCPGDFGGERGRLTPVWWDSKDSQYGLLKRWLVNCEGSFIDGCLLSELTIDDLQLRQRGVITVRIGVQPQAAHVGGINLFGRSFGNYPQDLVLRIEYTRGRPSG